MLIQFIAVAAAYFVKGVSGFANTLVFSTIMNFFTANINIVPVEVLLGTPSNIIVSRAMRRDIDLKVALKLILVMTAGMLPGVFILKTGDDKILKIILGISILFMGAEMLTRGKRRASGTVWHIWLLALVTGVLMGIFGIGATMVVCVDRLTKNTRSMRGTLSAVFLADNIIRIILYIATGVLTWNIALSAIKLAPFMLVGLYAGLKLSGKLPDKTVRLFIILMLMASGLSLALTSILG